MSKSEIAVALSRAKVSAQADVGSAEEVELGLGNGGKTAMSVELRTHSAAELGLLQAAGTPRHSRCTVAGGADFGESGPVSIAELPIAIDREKIAEFCRARGIRRLSLFGSVLR